MQVPAKQRGAGQRTLINKYPPEGVVMQPELQKLAGLVSVDGPIHPNDADGVCLDFDYEFGWTCGFYKWHSCGRQFLICASGACQTPELAVRECFENAEAKGWL